MVDSINYLLDYFDIKWEDMMLEAYGNIWDIADEGGWDAVVVTTNGSVAKNGRAVMGAGIAKEAADRYPELPGQLAAVLKSVGNVVEVFYYGPPYDIVTFPVKRWWREPANMALIEKSTKELIYFTNRYEWKDVLLPRPGCGNGGLKWSEVKGLLKDYLDDRFTVVTWRP